MASSSPSDRMTPNPNPSPEEALRHLELLALNTAQTAPAARKVNECVSLLTAALSPQILPAPGKVEANLEAQRQTIEACARICDRMVADKNLPAEANNAAWNLAVGIRALRPNLSLATVAAANDEAFARGVEAAANLALADSRMYADPEVAGSVYQLSAAIRLLSQGGVK